MNEGRKNSSIEKFPFSQLYSRKVTSGARWISRPNLFKHQRENTFIRVNVFLIARYTLLSRWISPLTIIFPLPPPSKREEEISIPESYLDYTTFAIRGEGFKPMLPFVVFFPPTRLIAPTEIIWKVRVTEFSFSLSFYLENDEERPRLLRLD